MVLNQYRKIGEIFLFPTGSIKKKFYFRFFFDFAGSAFGSSFL